MRENARICRQKTLIYGLSDKRVKVFLTELSLNLNWLEISWGLSEFPFFPDMNYQLYWGHR